MSDSGMMSSDSPPGNPDEPDEVPDDAKEIREELPKRRRTASGFEPLPGSFPSTPNLLRPRFVIGSELDSMKKGPFLQGPAFAREPGLFRKALIRNHEQNQDPSSQILPQASSAVAAFFNDPTSPSYNPQQPAQVTIPYQGEISTLTLEKLEDPKFVHAMSTRYEIQPVPQEIKHFGSVEQYNDWRKNKWPVPLAPREMGNRPVPILRKVDGRWKCVSVACFISNLEHRLIAESFSHFVDTGITRSGSARR
ncbi:MAG: hypothetical protein LQ342_008221 [Letrouitia transgressa]|nr:MAG: hypothetical protein LQ342_008221 [Letrouitia transgressa]